MYLDDIEDITIFHNSTYAEDYGIYMNDQANLDVRNNIFFSNSDYAFYSPDSVAINLDYNLYYTNGTDLVRYGGTSNVYSNLSAWQSAMPSENANSLQGNPMYVMNGENLHLTGGLASNAGDNSVNIMFDYDGQPRPLSPDTTVDIGADEFLLPPSYSYYPIGQINGEDSVGIADSLGRQVATSGTVIGVDLNSGSGYQFTLIDMSSSSQEGIGAISNNDLTGYVVNEGDSLMVYGTVGQTNGLTAILLDSIVIIDTNSFIPSPIGVNLLDESTESKWLSLLDDFILLDSSGSGTYNMTATNGIDTISIHVNSSTDIDDSLSGSNALLPGDTICGLLGIGGQDDPTLPFTDDYQIVPVRYSDLSICRLPIGVVQVESKATYLNLFPNPTSGLISIETNGLNNDNAFITVRDISGKIIFRENILNATAGFSKQLNISDKAKGIYFISIQDGDQLINRKIVLQ
jgi:hypothetical protein